MTRAKVSVDIVSDPVCPWCWLGHRQWMEACSKVKGTDIETLYRPFQLDQLIPREGRPYKEYMNSKFSGDARSQWKAMREFLENAAPQAGITFRFDDIQHRPNTLDAHRVIRWAQGQGEQAARTMKESIFKAFFEDLEDIGDKSVLARLAGKAGLDETIVSDLLSTDRDLNAVQEEELFYRRLGVSGVPTYIFNGKFAIAGAQGVDSLVKAIREAATLPPESQ